MKPTILMVSMLVCCSTLHSQSLSQQVSLSKVIPLKLASGSNPLIDARGFSKVSAESARLIGKRSLSEDEFLKAASEEGVIILDARSANRYVMRHIVGAKNLPFTDFAASTLAEVIPTKDTKVLIYCNNNFEGDQVAFMSKVGTTSLNLHTASSLRSYGYTNVYQLGPLLNLSTTKIPFEGTSVARDLKWLRSLTAQGNQVTEASQSGLP